MWGEYSPEGRPVVFCTYKEFMEHSYSYLYHNKETTHFDISSPTEDTYAHACVLNCITGLDNSFSFRKQSTEQKDRNIQNYKEVVCFDKISANTVMLAPRLDLAFKPVGMQYRGYKIPGIRKHWKNFIEQQECDISIEMPLWMFNSGIRKYFKEDTQFLVPHRERNQWGEGNYLFYMQTVFPWLFTRDPEGWGSAGSYMGKFEPLKPTTSHAFNALNKYIRDGNSKFKQPSKGFYCTEPYIAIPLQIPHDEVIKRHSRVSCEQFVTELCRWKDKNPQAPKLVFKGHPINLTSMAPLRKIISKCKGAVYIEDCNIHSFIELAEATFVINSGTGQEAMLLDSTVVCFGGAEYEDAVIKGDIHNLSKTWNRVLVDDKEKRKEIYRRWYDWYINGVVYATN